MTELAKTYEHKRSALHRASGRLRALLEEVIATIEDRTLVRAEVRSIRVKELSSVEWKAKENGWKANEAMSHCGDLIGGRVVCNNIEDVSRFAELLKERLPEFDVQDYTKEPNKGGYRALHVNFRLDVGAFPVPCEVQIRSLLQDAWAELSHGDIYKQPNLPEDLHARAKDLAEVLASADKIASDIRLCAGRLTSSPDHRPDLDHVSEEGLAFIFRDVFGRSPPDYMIRQGLNLCRKLGITSLERLPEVLGRKEFRDKVAETYRLIVAVSIGVEGIFLASLDALARGDVSAIQQVRSDARREWRDIEQPARREALNSLPTTIEELIEQLEDPRGEADIKEWAEALGATSDCAICSTTVIQPDSFAGAVAEHYELSETEADNVHERIETALCASGVETGGWGDGLLCARDNEQWAKDD